MATADDLWNQFLRDVEQAREQLCPATGFEPWYRGQTDSSYTLLPSLFRSFPNPNSDASWGKIWGVESDLFYEFRARARELHEAIEDDWDYLFAMQHYGTPTRLLDWTEVLSVAIYFATLGVNDEEKNERNAQSPCVWILNPYRLNCDSTGDDNADLFDPPMLGWDDKLKTYYSYGELLLEDGIDFDWPLAIYPRQRNPRIHAQRAWFTIHGDEFIPLEELANQKEYLAKVELPLEAIPAARKFLDLAGINHYLLFADLESLSVHLREKNGLITKTQAERLWSKRLSVREGH